MNKWSKIGALTVLLILLLGVSYYLYSKQLMNYLIITGTLSVICALVLGNTVITTRSEDSMYKAKLRQILRTYDSVLVKSKNLPKLDEKNIIKVDTIEDLVDAQMEIRKPIYYQEQSESCAFVLLDNNEACIYILKVNDNVLCPVEIAINDLEIKKKTEEKAEQQNSNDESITEELLKDINNTTIIRVKKGKYVKVSPLRKDKKQDVKEKVEEVKDKVEEKTEEIKESIEEKVQQTKDVVEETKNKVEAMDQKTEEIKDAVVEKDSNNSETKENKKDKKQASQDVEVLDL